MSGENVDNAFLQPEGGSTDNKLKLGGSVVDATETQASAIADATGGATVDAEARTAINALLAVARSLGLIAT